jgi:glycosyltransferase involved in cell wall biosynthesis
MRVLMLGWEFPPFIAGGLGTACYGLTRALNTRGIDVLFVLPKPIHAATPGRIALTGAHYEHSESHLAPAQRQATDLPPIPAVVHSAVERATSSSGPTYGRDLSEGVASGTDASPAPFAELPAYAHPDMPHVSFRTVDVLLKPYLTAREYRRLLEMPQAGPSATPAYPARGAAASGVAPALAAAMAGNLPSASAPNLPASLAMSNGSAPTAPSTPVAPAAPVAADVPASAGLQKTSPAPYAPDLFHEARRYADLVSAVAAEHTFDVIHAHDWMTFPAGLAVAERTGRPLVVHVHSTEIDRSGQNANPEIVAIERAGLTGATHIIAVSNLTKRLLVAHYGVAPDKVTVIHNAIDIPPRTSTAKEHASGGVDAIRKDEKVVLFLGRITAQKGPEYFLAAAQKVLGVLPNTKFIMAGAGDLLETTVDLAAAMGIGHKVLFTGFLNSRDVQRAYQMADLFVLSSVSEPFGIAPLEALANDVPVIISKQSGVSEVLEHALKVDFWDTEELANKIVAVLKHPALARTLKKNAKVEVRKRSWADAAGDVLGLYEDLLAEPVET